MRRQESIPLLGRTYCSWKVSLSQFRKVRKGNMRKLWHTTYWQRARAWRVLGGRARATLKQQQSYSAMSSLCFRANMSILSIPWSMTSEMHDNHVTGVMGAPTSRRDVVMLLQRAGLLPALKSSYKYNQFHFIISTRFNLLIWFASDDYLIFRWEAFAFFNYWTHLPHFDNNLLLTRWTRLFRFPMVSSVHHPVHDVVSRHNIMDVWNWQQEQTTSCSYVVPDLWIKNSNKSHF